MDTKIPFGISLSEGRCSMIRKVAALFVLVFFITINTTQGHDGIFSDKASINGVEIYYEIEGDGPPILLMHGGLGGDHWTFHWPGALRPLADTYKLIYYDHRGNGRSTGAANTVTFENLSKDAEGLRQFLGLGKVIVLGASYGGVIALHYTLHYPDSVAGLILQSAGYDGSLPFGEIPPGTEDQTGKLAHFFISNEKRLEFLEKDQTIEKNLNYACYSETFSALPRLSEIIVPTQILASQTDYAWRWSDTLDMANGLPHADFVVFENSSHNIHIEETELYNLAIRDFLSTVYPPTSITPKHSLPILWGNIRTGK